MKMNNLIKVKQALVDPPTEPSPTKSLKEEEGNIQDKK